MELILILLALFGLACLAAFVLAILLDRAQDWAFDVEDTRLWH